VTFSREKLDAPVFFDASAHSFYHLWNAVVHLADNPVVLGLIVLVKSPACQRASHTLPKRLWLQTRDRLDERANDEATIL
jgi:hypothetical protein